MIQTYSEFDAADLALKALLSYFNDTNQYKKEQDIVAVDVGAGQPVFYSNMTVFRNLGAKIICIEPQPRNIDLFKQEGFPVLQYAVTEDDSQSEVLFREFIKNGHQGLSMSTIASVSDLYQKKRPDEDHIIEYVVPAKSLNSILKLHHPEVNEIDVLDVDTEGNEIGILKGLDFNFYKPKVLIIENNSTEHENYDIFYSSIGYTKYAKCAHNDVLIRNI